LWPLRIDSVLLLLFTGGCDIALLPCSLFVIEMHFIIGHFTVNSSILLMLHHYNSTWLLSWNLIAIVAFIFDCIIL
jgi:hypothetical protein